MAYAELTDRTSWEGSRKTLRFTAAAVAAIEAHAALAKPLRAQLTAWNEVDQARRDADDAVVDANARVSALNMLLDGSVGQLMSRLLYESNNDRSARGFVAYFPEPPNEVIRLGLETEVARCDKLHAVAKELGCSKQVTTLLGEIGRIQQSGRAALADRKSAVEQVAAVSLRIMGWKDDTNAVRRSVENTLDAYAIKNGLPRDYSDAFFPASSVRRARTKNPAAPVAPSQPA